MFFLKHTAKESQKISKTDAKKLRQDVLSLVSDSFEPLVDFILGKKSAVEKLRWGFGSGGLANIFLVDEIPYFISLDGFVNTDEKFNFMKGTIRKIVPTVFFFLKARQFFNGDAVKQRELTQNVSHFVETFEMTSKFILSGAHLMTPGIIRMELRENSLKEASLALVHSRGNCVPYAVGFVSDSLAGGSPSGVGVYIVHSFGDALWTMYHEVFVAKSAGFPDCVPKEFCSGIVREVTIDLDCEPKADALPIPIESNDEQEVLPNGEDSQANWCSLFVGDDAILDFCLCESLQVISRTMLPFPVNQFTAVFLTCYPRGCGILKPQFKDTAYKHAVAFYRARPDTIVMDEKEKGVFVITSFNKWSKLMAEHKRQYESFLSDVHRPALHREAQDAEAAMLRDSRIVFNQSIASISLSFRPKRSIPIPMAKILLGGLCGRSSSTCQYPSLQDLEMGKCEQETVEAEDPFDYTLLDDLYSRKHIMDNLKEYIRNNSLMVVEVENKGLPTIQLDEALMTLQKGIVEDSLPLNVVEERALNQFSTMHEICVQFSIAGSSLTSGAIPPKYMLKSGNLPIVNIWTEKRAGNKVITIAKGLEALGFDLSLLSKAWQHLFSTSCSVFDPSVDMKNLKSGTKIPLEVHLQGNHAAKLQSVLSQDLSIPRNLVVSKKG